MKNLPESKLTRSQTKTERVTVKDSKLYSEFNGKCLKIEIRYDDECGNGHNSFAITGECGGSRGIGGCIHEFITEQAPHLKPFIKWHLTSSDGPMHYLANTLYHIEETKKNTIPTSYSTSLKFDGVPFTFDLNREFLSFLKTYKTGDKIELVELPYDGRDSYDFRDNYTFDPSTKGTAKSWYKSMFNDKGKAEQMKEALETIPFDLVQSVNSYKSEKESDLEAARNSSLWFEANKEDFTEENLLARLPKLMKEFKEAIEELGFTY